MLALSGLAQIALAALPPAGASPVIAFPSGWSQPPASNRVIQYQALAPHIQQGAELTLTKWFNWLSEPVRVKPRLAEPLQQVSPANPFGLTQPESTTADRWVSWTNEPVRVKPRLSEALQQVSPDNPYGMSVPETVTVDRWVSWTNEPTRLNNRQSVLPAALQQVSPNNPFGMLSPETSTADRWFNWLSEPVRIRPALGTYLQQYLQDTRLQAVPELTLTKWFNWLSEPVRTLPRLITGAQRADFLTQAAPFTESATVDRWVSWTNEPTRIRPVGINQTLQHFFEFQPTPIINISWFNWLTEPVRTKLALPAPEQHFFEMEPEAKEVGLLPWFNWLSEPKRFRPQLPAPEQHFFEMEPEPPEFFDIPWFNWLSEPVRFKLGGLSYLYLEPSLWVKIIQPALVGRRRPLFTPEKSIFQTDALYPSNLWKGGTD